MFTQQACVTSESMIEAREKEDLHQEQPTTLSTRRLDNPHLEQLAQQKSPFRRLSLSSSCRSRHVFAHSWIVKLSHPLSYPLLTPFWEMRWQRGQSLEKRNKGIAVHLLCYHSVDRADSREVCLTICCTGGRRPGGHSGKQLN
jgi:hypothetical protein